MGSEYHEFPLPISDDACVGIIPFETGLMTTPVAALIEGAGASSSATSWRFFVSHKKLGAKFWFDMGISSVSTQTTSPSIPRWRNDKVYLTKSVLPKDLSVYPRSLEKVHDHFKPVTSKRTIVEDTLRTGSRPEEIQYVIAR
jgi:hypothetical protein